MGRLHVGKRVSVQDVDVLVTVTQHWTGLWKVVRMAGFMYLLPQFKTAETRLAPWPSRSYPPSPAGHAFFTK